MVALNSQDLLNMRSHPNVKTWRACSKLCSSDPECNVWSWNHGGSTEWPFYCRTAFDYGYFGKDTNVISGYKDCTGLDLRLIQFTTF